MDRTLRKIAAGVLMTGLASCVTPSETTPAPSAATAAAADATTVEAPAPISANSQGRPAPEATGEALKPQTGAADYGRRPASQWRTNDAAIALIKSLEGLRLDAYPSGSQWLIGYGHSRGVTPGMTITEAEAEQFLREDLRDCEMSVEKFITVPVTENEFGALVSLCYNLGAGGFSRTTVVAALNRGDYAGAADAFLNHARGPVNGEKQVNEHLLERRKKERALFLTP